MYVKESSQLGDLGEFGIIVQGIIGAVQSATYGVANALEYRATKKYLSKEKKTLRFETQSALDAKQKELANRERLLHLKGQDELTKDANVKKLVIIGGITASALAVLGIVIYCIVYLWAPDPGLGPTLGVGPFGKLVGPSFSLSDNSEFSFLSLAVISFASFKISVSIPA